MTTITEPSLHVVGTSTAVSVARLCTPADFERWLRRAEPGDRIVYAQAFWLPKRAVSETVAQTQNAFDEGLIDFFQRSLGQGMPSLYFAIAKRPGLRPANPFTPRVPRAEPSLAQRVFPRKAQS